MRPFAATILAFVLWVCGFATEAAKATPATPDCRIVCAKGEKKDAAETAAALIRRADGANSELEEFDHRLIAANWVLAHPLAPIASRRLLGIARDGDAAEGARLVTLAAGQLERAHRVWQGKPAEKELDDEGRWVRAENLDALRAFARAFRALWPAKPMTEQDTDDALREAAAKLTVLLEADRTEVAEAGMLWQAYIYGQRGDLDRARDLLPLVMKEMPRNDATAHLARLLRCRYFAHRDGGAAVAIALLARVEQRCQDWFDEGSERAARHSAALVRRQLLTAWAERSRRAGTPEGVAWCEQAIGQLDAEYFAKAEPVKVLGLDHAAPLIVSEASPAGIPAKQPPADPSGDEFDGS